LRINPANDRPDLLVEVESLAGIGIEIQVVRAVARVDERESTGFRIVEGHLPRTASNREPLCKPVGRVAAPRGVLGGTNLGRQPGAPFAVERRTMRIGGIVWWVRPEVLHAPIEGWPTRRQETRRHFCFGRARGNLQLEGAMFSRIQDGERAMRQRR